MIKIDGFQLKKIRLSKELTLLDVFSFTDIIPSVISNIENGISRNPSFNVVATLCMFYGIDVKQVSLEDKSLTYKKIL